MKEPWLWGTADAVVAALLLLNVLLLVWVHLREVRERHRRGRAARFEASFIATLAEVRSERPDEASLRRQLENLDRFERPIAARMVIEELRAAPADRRARILEALRQIGAIDAMLRSTRRRIPWRRALAVRTLGLTGAEEAVPTLIARLTDRSRYVREAAVRALGRIRDERAVPALGELFAEPQAAAPGLVYEALLAIGGSAALVFEEGLDARNEHVRVAALYGLASLLDRDRASAQAARMLDDDAAAVRAAAAEVLGRLGGRSVPTALERATRDEQYTVRRAAVSALSGYDEPRAVRLAVEALDDPDRDTAVRAGETIVRLGDIAAIDDWPLERARMLASLER